MNPSQPRWGMGFKWAIISLSKSLQRLLGHPISKLLTDCKASVEGFFPMSNDSTVALSSFQAIPQLSRPDADLVLVFMSKNTGFMQPVDDPWFTATVPQVITLELQGGALHNMTTYYADDPVSVMGCQERYYWCNIANGKCTPLRGSVSGPDKDTAIAALDLNPRQNATFARLSLALGTTSILNIVRYLGASSLLATQYSNSNAAESSPLPSNQWILELAHWFGTGMVKSPLLAADLQ